jgi:predicted DsbA family dithiol-disulfide isomerase
VEIHPEIPAEGLEWPVYLRARFGGMSELLRQEASQAGLAMVVPAVIPKSRRALEASEYAREQDCHEAFHHVVFRKFYGEGQDLSRWDVLRTAAQEVGLDANMMQQKTESGTYTAVVDAHMRELAALGASGVPLFIFDRKYAVVGLQPYDAFQEVMAHIEMDNEET